MPKCPLLKVSNADFADCNGDYLYSYSLSVSWAPDRPVYVHTDKDRVLFWNTGGLGWSIGKADYLKSGNHWHRSALDTEEPWQGKWVEGAVVECDTPQRETKSQESCEYGSYGRWSRCSATCGVGTQTRERRVTRGSRCRATSESRPCQAAPCPKACQWGGWGSWGSCSKSCGSGVQTRSRNVLTRAVSGGECDESAGRQERACAASECEAEDCCHQIAVRSSGGARLDQGFYMGVYTRMEREYNGRPAYNKTDGREPLYVYYFTSIRDGISLWVIGPQLGQFVAGVRNSQEAGCVHDLRSGWTYASREGVWEDSDRSLSVRCYKREGPATSTGSRGTTNPELSRDCIWSQWGAWSECTKSCDGGESQRTRREAVKRIGAGRQCPGGNSERRRCNQQRCPRITTTTTTTELSVDCKWSRWGSWSSCSRSCNRGEKVRKRREQVKQQGAGRRCRGGDRDRRSCNTQSCPTTTTTTTELSVDCVWSQWGAWSQCSRSCNVGETVRTRRELVSQQGAGQRCFGDDKDRRSCNTQRCPVPTTTELSVDCLWSQWSSWSDCTQSCDGGEKLRTRRELVRQQGAGRECFGDNEDRKSCNTQRCPVPTTTSTTTTELSVDCFWSQWSSWSDCTQSCDGGEKLRTRRELVSQQGAGQRCFGDNEDRRSCNTQRCPVETTSTTSTTRPTTTELSVDCEWSQWGDWSGCSQSCDGGEETRTRTVGPTKNWRLSD